VRKAFEPQSFSVADGKTAPLSGTVADVPQKTFQVAWDQAGFNAAAAEVHPQATVYVVSLSVSEMSHYQPADPYNLASKVERQPSRALRARKPSWMPASPVM
jgi:hypothetical protein